MNSEQGNQRHDKGVMQSEIVYFSNVFEHQVLLFNLISVAVFLSGLQMS